MLSAILYAKKLSMIHGKSCWVASMSAYEKADHKSAGAPTTHELSDKSFSAAISGQVEKRCS